MRLQLVLLFLVITAAICNGAERQWQTGTWTDVGLKRKVIDFGPGASGFGQPRTTPTMRAMADVHTYVIETAALRLELEDVVQIGHASVEAVVGAPVTFALEKKTVYVREPGGREYRLRITKKTSKAKS